MEVRPRHYPAVAFLLGGAFGLFLGYGLGNAKVGPGVLRQVQRVLFYMGDVVGEAAEEIR